MSIEQVNSVSFIKNLHKKIKNNTTYTIPNTDNYIISNSAGLDKNGEIPSVCLRRLGLNRIVVGTITYNKKRGNREKRLAYDAINSNLYNRIGLHNKGCHNLISQFKKQKRVLPVTISVAIDHKDLQPYLQFRNLVKETHTYCDRYELNISCLNTQVHNYPNLIHDMISGIKTKSHDIYVKISADITDSMIKEVVGICKYYSVAGIVGVNSSGEFMEGWSTSGSIIKELSITVQNKVIQEIKQQKANLKYIASGGILTYEDITKRIQLGASEVQVYSMLVFNEALNDRNV